MYNIYTENKKSLEREKQLKMEKNRLINLQKHRDKNNKLMNNYQKKIKRFIIDVRIIFII